MLLTIRSPKLLQFFGWKARGNGFPSYVRASHRLWWRWWLTKQETGVSNVTELRQPFRKRFVAWLKSSRGDRLGWLAAIVVLASVFEDVGGHTDKATYMLCIAILLLLIIRLQQTDI